MANTVKTYRAKERGYVDGRIVEPGQLFSTSAEKGEWMDPVKGSETALQRAVEDAIKPQSDDPDLNQLNLAALQAMATEKGVTNVAGLKKQDLVTAIRAAYDQDRAR